jgi:glutaredoxin-like YruB-family protein
MNVEIYTSPTCGYCHRAKQYLASRRVPYVEYDVSRDRQAGQRMLQITGQGGVPVIVIDGEVTIGFNVDRLEALLSRNGGNGHRAKLGLKVADGQRFSGLEGAYVGVVEGGSAGERAGLKAGDTIVAIDSSRIGGAVDLGQVVAGLQPGSTVAVVFIRNKKSMQTRLAI